MSNTCDVDPTPPLRRSGARLMSAVLAAVMSIFLLGGVLSARTPSPAQAQSTQQRGFTLPTWQVDGYDGPDVERSLDEIKAVGATWVQFTPTWYQQTRYSNQMTRTAGTVSDAGVERAVRLAHQRQLKVLLKPHVDLPVPGQDSRNNIVPEDRTAWFAAYTGFITHYAAMAERLGVEQFAVGTELSSISDDRGRWLPVIGAVRDVYDGVVLYAAGRDYQTVAFWDTLDLIGIDAYLSLGPVPTRDVQALQRSWQPAVQQLQAMSARYGLGVVFTEAGYTSQRGTITDPSNWRVATTVDEAEQAAAYRALLTTFSGQPWWRGVFWWVWITPPFTQPEPLDFSPKAKEAEAVIRQWWAA